MKSKFAPFLVTLLLSPSFLQAGAVTVRPERMSDAARIRLDLDRLGVIGAALYVAAHPDDENTAMISWLANGKLVRAGYLAATRGDGGQNLIGTEKSELLGVIRTAELLEARKIDGGEQFFSRAIDFGYSKTAEETLRIWGRERILGDFVRVIRMFRPDVIITRFPVNGDGGHGHHTASAILAEEAFRLAGDPTAYPEQLGQYGTWQPRRIFWNAWRLENTAGLLAVDLGAFNPLLGLSYSELAGESRSMHKSQGFGAPERRGSIPNHLELRGGDPAITDPFEGIDLTWRRIAGGGTVIPLLDRARAAFSAEEPAAIVPHLIAFRRALQALPLGEMWQQKVIEEKIEDTDALIRQAAGIWIEAIASQPSVIPGSAVEVNLAVINRSSHPVTAAVAERSSTPAAVPYNTPWTEPVTLTIPGDARFTHPFWLRAAHDGAAYSIHEASLIGRAVAPAPLSVEVLLTVAGEPLVFEVPVMYRWTDPVMGERYRELEIHPPVTANFENGVLVFPDRESRRVRALIAAESDGASGRVRILVPEGWKAEPASVPFAIAKKGGEQPIAFTVTPPAEPATADISLLLEPDGWPSPYSLAKATLDYPHIPITTLLPHATAKLVRADVARVGSRIGYVMGAGDQVPDALRQIGYEVTLLSDEELEGGDLSVYDAIVIGVRAYNTRKRLASVQPRLFDWVAAGGALVTQYNTLDRDLPPNLGPFPFQLSRERVTVEESPVSIVDPSHPLMARPNRIVASDFEGWVQERGLYFPGTWDPAYTAPLVMFEPGESGKRGSILHARHGEGVFIYTPISFFRQLPAGVPGAYRLFANLVSAGEGIQHGAD